MKAAVTCVSLRLVLICSRDGRATVQSELFGSSRPKVQRACHQRALSPNLWPAPRRRKNRSTRLMTESSSRRTYTLYSGTSNLRLPPEMQEECHFGVIEKWPYLEATKAGACGLRHERCLHVPRLWEPRFVHHRALDRENSLGLVATYRQCSRRPPTKIAEAFFSSPGVHPPLANREPLHCCKSCEVIEAATPPQCGHRVPKRKRPPRD
jgi:hypothetical protein